VTSNVYSFPDDGASPGPADRTSSFPHRMNRASRNRNERRRLAVLAVGSLCLLAALVRPTVSQAQSLKGSSASLDRQTRVAREHDFTYISTGKRIRTFVDNGWLVRVRASEDIELHAVSYPYARPEVELFVRRLASQYRAACGERLVVTSLTRPASAQPRNASDRSVHPTGMALDVRYSRTVSCRRWLERVLLDLERTGIIEATRELRPPHYHIAVFPRQYQAYVDRLTSASSTRVADASTSRATSGAPTVATDEAEASVSAYKVRRGDSLWTIARAHGTTVADLRSRNHLRGSKILAGQVLEVPLGR